MSTAGITPANRPSVSHRIQAAWQSFVMAIIVVFSCGLAGASDVEHGVQASATHSSSFYAPEFRSNASASVPSIPSLPSSYSYQSRIQTERRGLGMEAHRPTQPHTRFSPYTRYSHPSPLPRPIRPHINEIVTRSYVGDRVIIRAQPTVVTQPPNTYKPGQPIRADLPNVSSILSQIPLERPSECDVNKLVTQPITPPPSPKRVSSTSISHPTPPCSMSTERRVSEAIPGDVYGGVYFGPNESTESDIDVPSDIPPIQSVEIVGKDIQGVRASMPRETRTSDEVPTTPDNHPKPVPRPLSEAFEYQQLAELMARANGIPANQVLALDSETRVHHTIHPYSGIPIIRVHRPESSISGGNFVEISITFEDERSLTSSSTSLFDFASNSSTSAVDSTEVPDATDCCSASVSSGSIYSQDDLPSNVAIKLPGTNGQETGLNPRSQIQDDRGSMVSVSDVFEGYHGESNENPTLGDEEASDACSIISDGGVAQNEYRLSITAFDRETVQLAAEFRGKSEFIRSTYPIRDIPRGSNVLEANVEPTGAGDSSLPAENSTSTVSVESNQFKCDEDHVEDKSPEGASAMSMTKSSSHLALLAALGLLTNQGPESPVTIPGPGTELQPSIRQNLSDSNIKYDNNSSHQVLDAEPSVAAHCSTPSSIPIGADHRKDTAPLRIIVPKNSNNFDMGTLHSSNFPSSSHSASDLGCDANALLPTPPCTPIDPRGPYQVLGQQHVTPSRPLAHSRLPSGIPARKALTPILPNQANKRETSSTTSSRLKSRTNRAIVLDPDTVPPVPPVPLVPLKRSPPSTKSTQSRTYPAFPAPDQSAPDFKLLTRSTIAQPSPTPVPGRLPRPLVSLDNTQRIAPAEVLPTNKALSAGIPSRGTSIQSRTPSVSATNATHSAPSQAPKSKAVTSEFSHAGRDSTRLWRAVELGHGLATPARTVDTPSRTNGRANASTPKFTRPSPILVRTLPVPTVADRPSE
ncbi:hypothetical protein FRC11_006187 [Ceratobasidium sp. 423]|nr:hypothetical protein FRC11_006187 [Ceratobasidium sp. 423]